MKNINWGIAGPGNIANKFAAAMKNVEGTKLCAVASRSVMRAQEFANRNQIEKVYGSYEEMAVDDTLDAIYILLRCFWETSQVR